jgi:hypothetical protein
VERLRRILRDRQRTMALQPVSQAILPNRAVNARAAANSLASAQSTSARRNTATARSPVENARPADRGASLAPSLTLILVLALILRIGFAAAHAVLLITAWAVVPIRLDAEAISVGAEFRRLTGISILGGLLASQVLVLLTTPMIYLWFDRLRQRCAEVRDADLGSPME